MGDRATIAQEDECAAGVHDNYLPPVSDRDSEINQYIFERYVEKEETEQGLQDIRFEL
jgi:hypothetical protein